MKRGRKGASCICSCRYNVYTFAIYNIESVYAMYIQMVSLSPKTKSFIMRMAPEDFMRWSADAERRQMRLSQWIRFCLDEVAGRNTAAMKERAKPRVARQPEEIVVGAGAIEGRDEASGRAAEVAVSPPRTLSSPQGFTSLRGQVRDLAQRDGKCTADVARGTRCKLCGKVH